MTDQNNGDTTSEIKSTQTAASADSDLKGRASKGPAATGPVSKPAVSGEAVKARLGWGARLILLLSLLISLSAAAAVGWFFYQEQIKRNEFLQERQEVLRELQGRSNQLEDLQSRIDQLSEHSQQERKAIRSARESREEIGARITALEKEITTVTGVNRIDWMLEEVEHFVTVAEQRLSLLGDARGALALLSEADKVVQEMAEAGTRNLRKALVRDIHKLKQASDSSLDVDGIFIRISSLTEQVDQLGIPTYELKQDSDLQPVEVLPEDGWDLFWHRFDHFLKSLFNYQKHEKGRPAILTADREFLVQSVILLLQQAQLALLSGDNEAYHLSLQGALQRAEMFIHQQTGVSKFFITELNDLLKVQLAPKVPTIEESQRAIQAFREYWNTEKQERARQVERLHRQTEKDQ